MGAEFKIIQDNSRYLRQQAPFSWTSPASFLAPSNSRFNIQDSRFNMQDSRFIAAIYEVRVRV